MHSRTLIGLVHGIAWKTARRQNPSHYIDVDQFHNELLDTLTRRARQCIGPAIFVGVSKPAFLRSLPMMVTGGGK